MNSEKLNLIGAYTTIFIFISICLVFIFRLLNWEKAEYWTGIVFMLAGIPLLYFLYAAFQINRPTIYYIQIVLMLLFIIVELLLDYIYKVEFRQTRWMVISYVTLFFAATGGMFGIASQAGKSWMIISVILFFIMTGLAFFQRAKTGM